MVRKRVAILGAGAAGCLCAVEIARRNPEVAVDLYEASGRPLAKVSMTGGGRCNLTNDFQGIRSLSEAYPRGEKLMKRLFHRFDNNDTLKWFEQEGVRFVLQEDHCYFPVTQDAMTIVRTLCRLMNKFGVTLHLHHRVAQIAPNEGGFELTFADEALKKAVCDFLVVTTGGFPKAGQFQIFEPLGLEIAAPVPSLFAFNLEDKAVRELGGAVVEDVVTSIEGTKFKAQGPLLITDFGMSAPAILKLSSYAARYLKECDYKFTLNINWMGETGIDAVRARLQQMAAENAMKLVTSIHPEELSARLWKLIVQRAGLAEDLRWNAVGKKALNKLVETLVNDKYAVSGKNKFKEEFVTCGGIALSELNMNTLEAKRYSGLFFAGEILDMDAITGGFNLQAAWTTGYVAAESVLSKLT